jgi:hypothetical protein
MDAPRCLFVLWIDMNCSSFISLGRAEKDIPTIASVAGKQTCAEFSIDLLLLQVAAARIR